MKWKNVTEMSWCERREGKTVFWVVGRVFRLCNPDLLWNLFSFWFLNLKSIVFSKRRETAKAVQAQVHNELIPVQLSALQV